MSVTLFYFTHYKRFVIFLFNSKKTPFRRWSCVTTSPCSASTKRRSSSSSTFPSHPTSSGLLLTPRSKDTERWGNHHFLQFFSSVAARGQISFFLNWLPMKGLIMMDGITGGIISLMDDWSLFTVHMNRWISHTSLRLFICLYWNIYLKTKWSKQVRRLDLNLIFFTQPPIWKGREICSCIIIMKMYHLRLRISLYHGTTVLSVVYRLCYSMWCHFLTC